LTDSKCILDEGLREVVGKVGSIELNEVLDEVAKNIAFDIGHAFYFGRPRPTGSGKKEASKTRTDAVLSFKATLQTQIKELIKEELRKDG
tara:strand:+ start:486 stop:755 length:270 start_codon:yes stop_codon:yes gene_type:complete